MQDIDNLCLTTEYGAIIQSIDFINQDDKIYLERRMHHTQFRPKYDLLPISQNLGCFQNYSLPENLNKDPVPIEYASQNIVHGSKIYKNEIKSNTYPKI